MGGFGTTRCEENERPEMKRYGVAFTPRVRGYSEYISPATAGKPERRRGRDTSGKAKDNESKLTYEKSENYIHDGPVRACLLRALPASAERHRRTNG